MGKNWEEIFKREFMEFGKRNEIEDRRWNICRILLFNRNDFFRFIIERLK